MGASHFHLLIDKNDGSKHLLAVGTLDWPKLSFTSAAFQNFLNFYLHDSSTCPSLRLTARFA